LCGEGAGIFDEHVESETYTLLCYEKIIFFIRYIEERVKLKTKLRGLSPRANYTDRAATAERSKLIDYFMYQNL